MGRTTKTDRTMLSYEDRVFVQARAVQTCCATTPACTATCCAWRRACSSSRRRRAARPSCTAQWPTACATSLASSSPTARSEPIHSHSSSLVPIAESLVSIHPPRQTSFAFLLNRLDVSMMNIHIFCSPQSTGPALPHRMLSIPQTHSGNISFVMLALSS